MKNIHILPTDKPSRLFYNAGGALLFTNYENHNGVNIYITSDEEIKEDYVIAYGFVIKVMMFDKETLYFVNGTKAKREDCKKIILTDNQDLIDDGVQAIDDEFIEWFVKNPICEVVEVQDISMQYHEEGYYEYKIIIPKEDWLLNNPHCKQIESCGKSLSKKCICPKEEPKQETPEEIAQRYYEDEVSINAFINGYKIAQEFLCNHNHILTSEQGHRVIKCSNCNDTQPI